MTVAAVILAAGYGTRMKSKLPKFLHPLAGRPLIEWSLQAVDGLSDLRPVVVVGHEKERLQDLLGARAAYSVQEELLGTGHALMQARQLLYQRVDQVLVLYSDMPLLRQETLRKSDATWFRQYKAAGRPNCVNYVDRRTRGVPGFRQDRARREGRCPEDRGRGGLYA